MNGSMHHAVFAVALAASALMSGASQGQQVRPTCTDNSRACMIKAAEAYLTSIVTHDASKVPFAADIIRTEQGRVTARGENEIREAQKKQPDMAGFVNARYFVDEKTHNVIAYTLLRVTGTKADPNRKTFTDNRPPEQLVPSTVHLAERFKVEGGLITEIEALFTIEPGSMDKSSGWPD